MRRYIIYFFFYVGLAMSVYVHSHVEIRANVDVINLNILVSSGGTFLAIIILTEPYVWNEAKKYFCCKRFTRFVDCCIRVNYRQDMTEKSLNSFI